MVSDKSQARFVADGRRRILRDERQRIKRRIRAKYAEELASAGWWSRMKILGRIRRETRAEIERIAPRGAHYARSR